MKTYYDGEEREILKIYHWSVVDRKNYWSVQYRRGDCVGALLVQAEDELDAMRKFLAALEEFSKNHPDDEE